MTQAVLEPDGVDPSWLAEATPGVVCVAAVLTASTAAQSATIEKRYFAATLVSASRSLAESGGACVPRRPGEPISPNIPSIPAGST
jgi:hypothetical protein